MRKILLSFLAVFTVTILLAGAGIAADQVVVDPIYIGVGARPMGMGKAFVAMAEDGDTVFTNPAGLGTINGPKLTSMYTSLMNDVNYIVIGGAYPHTANSAFGAGIITNNVAGIPLYDNAGQEQGTATWGTYDMFVSYGMYLPQSKLSIGGSLKYITQGGTGPEVNGLDPNKAAASGISFDVGALYMPTDNLTIGVVAQNPMGAKLESGYNQENSITPLFKVGTAFKTEVFNSQKVNLAIDCDLASKRDTTFHAGVEYIPLPMIAIRAGLDQDPGPDGVVTNPTAGVGLRVGYMEFNYAYHPYSLTGNDTHYFSLGYVGPMEEPPDFALNVRSPQDKSVIYSETVNVMGKVPAGHSEMVTVNGAAVAVDPKSGEFTYALPFDNVGKKLVVIETKDNKGKKVAETRRVLRLVSFRDVGDGYWAKKPIEHTGTVGLIQGYPDGSFRPDKSLTRAELATILVRTKGLTTVGKAIKVFKDVKTSHWAARYVELAKRAGLIKGYPNGKFMPNKKVSKAEAITILARYDNLPTFAVEEKPYADVATKHWAAPYIQAAKEGGMLDYVRDTRLRPKEEVSRAESVEMMSHTSLADKLIKELLSWDRGFEYELSKPMLKAGL